MSVPRIHVAVIVTYFKMFRRRIEEFSVLTSQSNFSLSPASAELASLCIFFPMLATKFRFIGSDFSEVVLLS